MIDSHFRNFYQNCFINPLTSNPFIQKISPIFLTILACISGIISSICIVLNHRFLAVFFLILSGYLDTLDGSIARKTNTTSDIGTILDITSDRIVEFACIFALYLVNPFSRATYCLLMTGSVLLCVCSFLVVGIFTPNSSEKNFYYSPGIMERTEAFLFFLAMIIFSYGFSYFAIVFITLTFFTAFFRIYQFVQKNNS